ncbi:hypothetical protein FHU42_000908 [Corynebacterium glutamicum]|nr:hypothetical protein [Corynebacterium glutamicum]
MVGDLDPQPQKSLLRGVRGWLGAGFAPRSAPCGIGERRGIGHAGAQVEQRGRDASRRLLLLNFHRLQQMQIWVDRCTGTAGGAEVAFTGQLVISGHHTAAGYPQLGG